MLAALPKLADRAFIIGFLLPSLIFIVVLLALFGDHATVAALLTPAKEENALSVLVLASGAWLLAVFMLVLNHWLYRCLEGYVPPFRWRRRQRWRYALRIARLGRDTAHLLAQWQTEGASFSKANKSRYRKLTLQRATLPALPSDALPTSFGNAIKAFEIYPREVYGADGVARWLRLAAVTPAKLLEAATDDRAQIDFMVNTGFFALATTACAAARAVLKLDVHAIVTAAIGGQPVALARLLPCGDFVAIAAAIGVALACYHFAVALVPACGDLVKACFDVGLPALAAKAAYRLPKTDAERRQFWSAFRQTMVYRNNPDGTPILRAEDGPAVTGGAAGEGGTKSCTSAAGEEAEGAGDA